MKKLITFIFLFACITNFAQSGQKNFIDQNYTEVTGKAEMEIVPDEIYLEIIIDEQDFKNKQSLESLEELMTEKLIKIGIDVSKDLAIKDLASNFKNYWMKSRTIYTSKNYQLIVHNANTAGLVFWELEAIGISNITIDRIDHSEIQKFREEVKVLAMKAAKSKATYLAGAIDQSIGKAIFIQEMGNFNFPGNSSGVSNIVVSAGAIYKDGKGSPPKIEFERIKLEYSVLARFELN